MGQPRSGLGRLGVHVAERCDAGRLETMGDFRRPPTRAERTGGGGDGRRCRRSGIHDPRITSAATPRPPDGPPVPPRPAPPAPRVPPAPPPPAPTPHPSTARG